MLNLTLENNGSIKWSLRHQQLTSKLCQTFYKRRFMSIRRNLSHTIQKALSTIGDLKTMFFLNNFGINTIGKLIQKKKINLTKINLTNIEFHKNDILQAPARANNAKNSPVSFGQYSVFVHPTSLLFQTLFVLISHSVFIFPFNSYLPYFSLKAPIMKTKIIAILIWVMVGVRSNHGAEF